MKHLRDLALRLAVALYVWARRNPIRRIESGQSLDFQPKSILVFSNTALGDTILSSPAIVSLRHSFPDARITLFLNRAIAPLFAGFEFADAIIAYHGGFKHFWRTVWELRRVRPDTALLLHSNAPQDIPMAVFSGATVILKTPTRSAYRRYLSTQFAPKRQHIIEERLDLVRAIGGRSLTTRMQLPRRHYTPGNGRQYPEFRGKAVIGFQAGAANVYKMWPAQNFTALADRLVRALPNGLIVITGSARERALGQQIANGCETAEVLNYCGRFSLDTLPDLMRNLDLLITNDTGTMHLAIALGTPTLCLFGPTAADLIGPYQDPELHRVIQKMGPDVAHVPKKKRTNETMRLISVDEVASVAIEMLAPRAAGNAR